MTCLDIMLSEYRWYRKARKGHWVQIQVNIDRCPVFWVKDEKGFYNEVVLDREFWG